MTGDREDPTEGTGMTNDLPDWTTEEYLANIAADELSSALDQYGIRYHNVSGNDDGTVGVSFVELRDAELMMTLGVEVAGPGSLYDRATGSCVSLSEMDENSTTITDAQVHAALTAGWDWQVHPHMTGRRMGWHVTVDIPTADANSLTVALNTLARGGAL